MIEGKYSAVCCRCCCFTLVSDGWRSCESRDDGTCYEENGLTQTLKTPNMAKKQLAVTVNLTRSNQ